MEKHLSSQEEFDQIISSSEIPVLVDFYADWCGPCRKLGPILQKKQKTKNFMILKINIDNFQELSNKYKVSGIPHVILFVKGVNTKSFTGIDINQLESMMKNVPNQTKQKINKTNPEKSPEKLKILNDNSPVKSKINKSIETKKSPPKAKNNVQQEPSKYKSTLVVPNDLMERIKFVKNIFKDLEKFFQHFPPSILIDDTINNLIAYSNEELIVFSAIYYWICKNIQYDFEGKQVSKLADNEPENVFRNKKCICAGYSNLFYHMCNLAGVKSEKITGYTKSIQHKQGDKLETHAWNLIYYRNEKYLVDSTWGAGYVTDGKYYHKLSPSYFLTFPEILIDAHFPEKNQHTLLKKNISLNEFKNRPYKKYEEFYSGIFNNDIILYTHKFPEVTVIGKSVTVELGLPGGQNLYMFGLTKNEINMPKSDIEHVFSSEICKIDAKFESDGQYKLSVWKTSGSDAKGGLSTSYTYLFEYILNVKLEDKYNKVNRRKDVKDDDVKRGRSVDKFNLTNSKLYEPKNTPRNKSVNNSLRYDLMNNKKFYDNTGCILYEPKNVNLKIGSNIKFRVKVRDAINVAVLDHRTWIYLKSKGDDIWEGMVNIQNEVITVLSQKASLVYTEVFEFRAIKQ